jgi:signal peptidase I
MDEISVRGERDAQRRPAAKPRGGVNPARGRGFDIGSGYGEPVRRARAQQPRPVDYERFSRGGSFEDDRPARRAQGKSRKKKKKTSGALVYWATAVVLALLIGFGVRTFGFELIRVSGNAMDMTLSSGEIVLVQKSVYYAAKPARGDIVGVNSPEGLLIRRVVALPGETIEIKGGVTYVNGEALEEPYVFQKDGGDCPLTTIPDGCYFVMGDNRVNTDDSRTFGLIKNTRSLIVGKVNSIVWPLDQWGTIH